MIKWLPNKKYYEYAYHKFFNPEVTYDKWQPWDQWTYPDADVLRFDHIINQQLSHITNRRVLDIACNLGYISLFCLHNNAEFVTGTNVRNRELSIADEICTLAGYSNYKFINSCIYNLNELLDLCNTHDTVVLSGIIYHINHHYQLLKTIADSSASCIIIETQFDNAIDIGTTPIISWSRENTQISSNGFEPGKDTTFIGTPNRRWVEQALIDLNFKISYNKTIEYSKVEGRFTQRGILTAIKDQT